MPLVPLKAASVVIALPAANSKMMPSFRDAEPNRSPPPSTTRPVDGEPPSNALKENNVVMEVASGGYLEDGAKAVRTPKWRGAEEIAAAVGDQPTCRIGTVNVVKGGEAGDGAVVDLLKTLPNVPAPAPLAVPKRLPPYSTRPPSGLMPVEFSSRTEATTEMEPLPAFTLKTVFG